VLDQIAQYAINRLVSAGLLFKIDQKRRLTHALLARFRMAPFKYRRRQLSTESSESGRVIGCN
jgi:hypothetical protein